MEFCPTVLRLTGFRLTRFRAMGSSSAGGRQCQRGCRRRPPCPTPAGMRTRCRRAAALPPSVSVR